MSLYQKYRPQEFDSLAGQEHIKRTLQQALKKDLVSHAYLFCGPRGTGKTTTARLIAKAVNCPDFNIETAEPCNKCKICEAITNSSLIDVIEIDAASNRGIDEIRELKETIRFAPTLAKNKVYIIDEVHMLTNEAFNALLKTIEEPPTNVYFILATTELHKVPETIISRCQRFDFKRINHQDLVDRLEFICKKEAIEFEREALEMISLFADGGLRDAISVMDQIAVCGKISTDQVKLSLGSTGVDTLQLFLKNLLQKNEIGAFEIIQSLHSQGSDIKQFQIEILKITREKLHHAIQNNDLQTKESLLNLIELWQEINNSFKHSIIQELPLEILVVKFCNEFKTAAIKMESPVLARVKPTAPVLKTNPAQTATRVVKPVEPVVQPIVEPIVQPTAKNVMENTAEISVDVPQNVSPENTKAEVPLNFDIIKNWKLIIDKVTIPTVRIALKNAKFSMSSEANCIELNVISNFEFDNLKKSENIKVIEDAVLEVSGVKYKINLKKEIVQYRQTENLVKKDIDARHSPADAFDPGPMDGPNDVIAGFKNNSADFAIDMFEGELIE